jgi:signal transduction histidine kinase
MRAITTRGAMSAATAASTRELPRRSRAPSDPLPLRAFAVACVVPVIVFLAWSLAAEPQAFIARMPEIVPWLVVVAIADMRPLPLWGSLEVALSFPVLLAAALVFPSPVACFLGLIGPLDRREIRREIPLLRALLNRSVIALSVLSASLTFRALGGDLTNWPWVAAPVLAALLVDVAVNATLVTIGGHFLTGLPLAQVFVKITGGTEQRYFLSSYLAFGLLALLLGTVHGRAGVWSPIAFGIPLFLARRMFVHWKEARAASEEAFRKQQALLATMQRIADERREERLSMAADIHDEVLQPLYQVHLMGQVLRQDLASGRLLELEEDLPGLLEAATAANDAIRGLLREIRTSPLGARGLTRTLSLLAEELRQFTDATIVLEMDEVGGAPLTQLLVYQIAREALTNAVRHANAKEIQLSLAVSEEYIRLVVRDDGQGLRRDWAQSEHFGLQMMRERAEAAGGTLLIDSTSRGVTVVARIPLTPGGEGFANGTRHIRPS